MNPALKQHLRPVVFHLRLALRRAMALVRRRQPWDGVHHPVLAHFPPWSGEADGTFFYDSLGVRTDPRFRSAFRPQPAGFLRTVHPAPHAAYFELVCVLESVLGAADREGLTIVELGAGYGHWSVTAARAMQATRRRPVLLVAVEMVPHHFRWLEEHLRNNGLDPAQHKLIRAAVGDREGVGWFRAETDPAADFGQRLIGGPATAPAELGKPAHGRIPVRVVPLETVLAGLGPVDLLHVDVQGAERQILPGSLPTLGHQVRRVICATHSGRTHRILRGAFLRAGWEPEWDFGVGRLARTPFGDVQFLDGLLAWSNPRLR